MRFITRFIAILSLSTAFTASAFAFGPSKPSTPAPAPTNLAIPGVIGPVIAVNGNYLTITVTLADLAVNVGADIPISGLPNSSIGVTPDVANGGGTDITFTLDFADVKAADIISGSTLPGGRPLPGIPAGELPAVGIQVPKLDNAVFYIGGNVFGFFIPVNLKVDGLIVSAPFYNSAGSFLGALSMVGDDSTGKNGGFLLLLNDSDITNLIQGKLP